MIVSSGARRSSADRRRAAFEVVFETHWAAVRRHIECFVDDPDEVHEVVADVFRVAWEKLRPDNAMGITWLLRTADNKLRDRERRARTRNRAMQALEQQATLPASEVDELERIALREALKHLSKRERQVIVLTYWDQLSAGEVAEVLRCSQPAVWTALTRGRARLRELLDVEGGGGRDRSGRRAGAPSL